MSGGCIQNQYSDGLLCVSAEGVYSRVKRQLGHLSRTCVRRRGPTQERMLRNAPVPPSEPHLEKPRSQRQRLPNCPEGMNDGCLLGMIWAKRSSQRPHEERQLQGKEQVCAE